MTTFLAVVAATVYVPMAGGINGGACVGKPIAACNYPTGTAACNYWPSGTMLELPAWVAEYGLPTRVVCLGGGGPAVDVDLALTSADVDADLARAFAWGRRTVEVQVTLPAHAHQVAPQRPVATAPPYAAHVERQAAQKAVWPRRADIQ